MMSLFKQVESVLTAATIHFEDCTFTVSNFIALSDTVKVIHFGIGKVIIKRDKMRFFLNVWDENLRDTRWYELIGSTKPYIVKTIENINV